MKEDPYKISAKRYDFFIEPLTRSLRHIGMKFYPPYKDMKVLDVGCGTGNSLKLYQKSGCQVHGIDSSPSMLKEAQKKLDEKADLRLGIASEIEYPNDFFDLAISMLSIHEMPKEIRPEVISEMSRVIKRDGRILLIDYHPNSNNFQSGWMNKVIIYIFEMAAGLEHFKNFRTFLKKNGISGLMDTGNLTLEKMRVVGGGNFGFYLIKRISNI